jgi:hypothetical protein
MKPTANVPFLGSHTEGKNARKKPVAHVSVGIGRYNYPLVVAEGLPDVTFKGTIRKF